MTLIPAHEPDAPVAPRASVLRPAIVSFLALTFVTGVVYPAAVTGIARLAFSDKAGGSVIERGGRAVGSGLIAQSFTDAKYFWPRPSAAHYDAAAGAGSNLAPGNPALMDTVSARTRSLRAGGITGTHVPADLVTTSASGLDPHISPDAAEVQIARVARARGLPDDPVRRAVAACTEGRTLGLLGAPRVNVLRLNLLLDAGGREEHASAPPRRVAGERGRAFLP